MWKNKNAMPVIDSNTQNMKKLATDDKNPHIPQVVMIDGEVMEVIYGSNEDKDKNIKSIVDFYMSIVYNYHYEE